MKCFLIRLAVLSTFTLVACSPDGATDTSQSADEPQYLALDAELTKLKADFNGMSDKLRLLFISGPSCGICLRGTNDLNEAIVASLQNDARVHTFVVYVPTLGAEEKHVAAAVPLMERPASAITGTRKAAAASSSRKRWVSMAAAASS